MQLSFDDDSAEEDDDEEEHEHAIKPEGGQDDEVYKRLRLMIEGLIQSGKRALETKPEDFGDGWKGGAKVLSAEEVRSWIGADKEGHSTDADMEKRHGAQSNRPTSPWKVAEPHGEDISFSEDGVEALGLRPNPMPATPPPPIRIVPST